MKRFREKVLAVTLSLGLVFGSMSGVVSAALPADAITLKGKLEAVYNHVSDMSKIESARDEIEDILESGTRFDDYGSVSQDFFTAINAKQGGGGVPISQEEVLDFVLNFILISFDKDLTTLETYIANNQPFLDDLAVLGGLAGFDSATYSGLTELYNDITSQIQSTVAGMPSSFSDISALFAYKNQLVTNVQTAINNSDSEIAEIFTTLGLTAQMIMDARIELMLTTDHVLAAELELAKAYKAMVGSPSSGDDGDGGSEVVVTTPPAQLPTQASDTAKEKLADLKDALSELTDNDKKSQLKDAQKDIAKAIKETAKIKVDVEVTGGKIKPVIDAADLINKAKEVKKIADELNAELEVVGGKKAKVEFTLDLGTVESDDAEITLDESLLKDIADAGIDSIALTVNGVEIAVDPKELPKGATLNIAKKEKTEAEQLTSLQVASDVYNFEFSSEGEEISSFKKPVELRIPVSNADDYDTDLLTLAKIIEDKLNYYVGKYDPDNGVVKGLRDSLSSYVIVENKVEFDDIASVSSWAGRPIEVAAAKGIIVGDGTGSFNPTDHVTRAEFVKMLVATFGLLDADATETFIDVKDSDWFKPYIASAVKLGLADGRSNAVFAPNVDITREEMAYMVGRALKLSLGADDVEDIDAVLSVFNDAELISDTHSADVAVTVNEGIMIGSYGNLNPNGNATRAEAAVVIKRLIDQL